jgi:hypothetical protein
MSSLGLSDKVRRVASTGYVQPQRAAGVSKFTIAVSEISRDLAREQFPPNHTPQICSALRSKKLLQAERLELERVEGPPSGQSTTVVFHYRFIDPPGPGTHAGGGAASGKRDGLERLRGVLRDVFREAGGGEAFLHSLRHDFEGEKREEG